MPVVITVLVRFDSTTLGLSLWPEIIG